MRFGIQLDNLDLAPCPCMPDWLRGHFGMPIGGLGLPLASIGAATNVLAGRLLSLGHRWTHWVLLFISLVAEFGSDLGLGKA